MPYNPSAWEMELEEGSEVQGHRQLLSQFQTGLGYKVGEGGRFWI